MGQLLVMFDLPTVKLSEVRAANRFRKGLLDQGFFMLQESVYARVCVSYEKTKSHIKRVESIAPEKGLITAIYITDRQWEGAFNVINTEKKRKRSTNVDDDMPKQMTFW